MLKSIAELPSDCLSLVGVRSQAQLVRRIENGQLVLNSSHEIMSQFVLKITSSEVGSEFSDIHGVTNINLLQFHLSLRVQHSDLSCAVSRFCEFTQEEQLSPPSLTDIETHLLKIWSECLGRKCIDVHEEFFSIGGDSLSAADIIAKIYDELSIDIETIDIFRYPTVSRLANHLLKGEVSPHFKEELADKFRIPLQSRRIFPLAPAQRRYWKDYFSKSPKSWSNVVIGPVDVPLQTLASQISHGLKVIASKNSVLRLQFPVIDGSLVQEYLPSIKITCSEVALRRTESISGLVRQLASRSFDLSGEPLFRCYLILDEENQRKHLLLIVHHLIIDGYSVPLLLRQLLEVVSKEGHGAEMIGNESNLLLNYEEYTARQLAYESSADHDVSLAYWMRELQGVNGLGGLPADIGKALSDDCEGRGVKFSIIGAQYDRLKRRCRELNCTVAEAVLSIFFLALRDIWALEDIIIGSPFSGRSSRNVRSLVGMLVNMVLLRIPSAGGYGKLEMIRCVSAKMRDALQHQHVQPDTIAERLGIPREIYRFPITNVFFSHLNAVDSPAKEQIFELHEYIGSTEARFAMMLYAFESDASLVLDLKYRKVLFSSSEVRAVLIHLVEALKDL